ncbi:hypothetical protein GMA12_02205 [Kocuria sediminis]|uniref:Hydrolytic protein n=1 Tax=Kocuria sediminis TaxID=1038857 RepID=A0A6N8GGB6_9MICC|nr:hypothetical protein [Kocuria sediminis]MUN61968.1 hypothetical protein [Kocuria sediminis]
MSPSAVLERPEVSLDAGGAAAVLLKVGNEGKSVDEYRFRVVGPLAPWTTVEPETVSVDSGDFAKVTVDLHVPRSSEVPAGSVPYGVQVLPSQNSVDPVVAEGVVQIRPFHDTVAKLVPQGSRGKRGGRHRLGVSNRGNASVDVRLVAKDPEERLHLHLRPSGLRVVPGTVQFADLTVRPRASIWRGTGTEHPFAISVEPDRGPSTVISGTHQQEAILPRWSLEAAAIFTLLALLAFLALLSVQRFGSAAREFSADAQVYVQRCLQDMVTGGDRVACRVWPPEDHVVEEDLEGGGAVEGTPPMVELAVTANVGGRKSAVFTLGGQNDAFNITTILLSGSKGDTGRWTLSRNGETVYYGTVEGFEGQAFAYAGVLLAPEQEMVLELECTGLDAEEATSPSDLCEVKAVLQGELIPLEG